MNYLISLQWLNTSGAQMMLANRLDKWKQFVMETYNSNPSSNPDTENEGDKSAADTEDEGDKSEMDTDDD